MTIGIDAKWYFEGPPSGRRVVMGLVDRILELDDENTYVIFLNGKHRERAFPGNGKKNIIACYVWAGNNLLSNVFVLPFFSGKHNLDALLYQNFISPFDRSKTIAYIHDVLFLSNPEFYTLTERLYFAPLRFLTRTADSVITVSEEERKRLTKFGFTRDGANITVVYHGVERGFSPQTSYPADLINRIQDKFKLPDRFLLFVGRLNLRKNVDTLLRSIPLLKNKEIPLVIVGADDWKTSNYMNVLTSLGIEGRVHFTGAVHKDLNVIYSLASLFCFPSHAESFGLPPLESMACGVPVVVSNTTSLPEICGEAGTYVDPDSPEQIASAIDNLLTNEHLYAEKRQKGLDRAKQFTWDRAVTQIVSLIQSVVKNNTIEKIY